VHRPSDHLDRLDGTHGPTALMLDRTMCFAMLGAARQT